MAHDGWMYQGRQYHQWFGHGTKPHDMGPPPGTLEDRIRTLGRTALASLPAAKRHHAAATFDSTASDHLVTAMRAWVDALRRPFASFAESLLGISVDHPAVGPLREAARRVAEAHDPATMRPASDALAAGMQAIGLDNWRSRLRDFANRAQSSAGPSKPAGPYKYQVRVGEPRIQTVAINFDPRTVPLTPAAERLDKLLKLTGQVVVSKANEEILSRRPMPRSNILHKMFADEVRRMELPGVKVEQTFDTSGEVVEYGTRGGTRTDVVFRNPVTNKIEGVWD